MADDFEAARNKLKDKIDFDLILAGINTHGTQPIGDYGRRYLMRLWQDVENTTGQKFGYKLPEEYIHDSSRTCLALQAARQLTGQVPFLFLHELQQRFFVLGENVTDQATIDRAAEQVGLPVAELQREMDREVTLEQLRFQFQNAQGFGTQALPSLVVREEDLSLRLLAGGYVDTDMMQVLLAEL